MRLRSGYKQFDDLLDGILCAYLAYYYWYWGEEGSWVVGDLNTGYVTLPRRRLRIAQSEPKRRGLTSFAFLLGLTRNCCSRLGSI
jgi:predicted RNase H-like nuclease